MNAQRALCEADAGQKLRNKEARTASRAINLDKRPARRLQLSDFARAAFEHSDSVRADLNEHTVYDNGDMLKTGAKKARQSRRAACGESHKDILFHFLSFLDGRGRTRGTA